MGCLYPGPRSARLTHLTMTVPIAMLCAAMSIQNSPDSPSPDSEKPPPPPPAAANSGADVAASAGADIATSFRAPAPPRHNESAAGEGKEGEGSMREEGITRGAQ